MQRSRKHFSLMGQRIQFLSASFVLKSIIFLALFFCCSTSTLEAANVRFGRPVKNDINVRVDSTPMSDVIGMLQTSDVVEIIEERYDWCRVRLPKRITCYVAADFLEEIRAGKGRVSASLLNLRSKPGSDSSVLGKVKKGDLLNIIERKDGWYKVIGYPYVLGWVHRSLLVPVSGDRFIRQEGVVLYLKPQRGCLANCLFKSDRKYLLRISSVRYQKFINKKVRIVGRRTKGECDYVLVKKLSFKK